MSGQSRRLVWNADTTPFDAETLRGLYRSGATTPAEVVRAAYRRIARDARPGVWIAFRPEGEAVAEAAALHSRDPDALPLFGLPFGVKDNVDVAGIDTTAACPAFAYRPRSSARSVARAIAAGAVCIGKTNLDQFATGLSGARSPYGACGSAFNADIVAGGSSSGSAVAVALHQVSFALGTDTGGSGRIPAGLNNVVGLKPTVGTISTDGLVPNCRTLDCVSVFALVVADALAVAEVMRGGADDASLRADAARAAFGIEPVPNRFRFAVPRIADRQFFGNREGLALFEDAVAALASCGGTPVEIDFAPFIEAGRMLFDGPWIAERMAALGSFLFAHRAEVLPVTLGIIERANAFSAVAAFDAFYRLRELRQVAREVFRGVDVLAVPTVGPRYTIAEMLADPVRRNADMGLYSYYANLLDLCAVSVPSGFHADGLPFGITLLGPAFADARVAALGAEFHRRRALPAGRPRG